MATATVSGLTLIEDMEGTIPNTDIGGGGPSGANTDIFIQASQSLGRKVSTTARRGFGVDITSLDLTVAGRQVWVWWNLPLGANNCDTRANGGVRIRFSSTAGGGSNYEEFNVGGSDTTVSGRWNRSILDPTNMTPAATNGTCVYTAIVNISITYTYTTTPGGNIDHVVLDAIHYGDTIQVTGGTSGDRLLWSDVSAATESSTNAWGVLRREGNGSPYLANGEIQIGATSGATNTYLQDSNQIIEWQDQLYHDGTSSVLSSVPTAFQGLTISNGTGTCSFTDGDKVGTGDTATGANGSIFQLPPGATTEGNFRASDVDVDDVFLYGSRIARMNNHTSFSDDVTNGPTHEILGVTFDDCDIISAGRVDYRNCTFQGYSGSQGAILWNSNIDIKNCAWRNNTFPGNLPAGIRHDTAGSYTYDNLTFLGNDFDIENAANATTADSYSETNQDAERPIGNGTNIGGGQSFTNGSAGVITNVRFYLREVGSTISGNIKAVLYALNGAIGGGDDLPTGPALATSDDYDVAGLTNTLALEQFNFSDNYTMAASTDYFIALELSTGYTGGDGSNYVSMGYDSSAPSATGNAAFDSGSGYVAQASSDVCFYVSRGGLVTINAQNGANPSTFQNVGSPPGGVRIVNSVAVTVTVNDIDGNPVQGARVYVQTDTGPFNDIDDIIREETNASGVATESFNYLSDTNIVVRVRKKGFVPFDGTGVIESGGFSTTVRFLSDPNQE